MTHNGGCCRRRNQRRQRLVTEKHLNSSLDVTKDLQSQISHKEGDRRRSSYAVFTRSLSVTSDGFRWAARLCRCINKSARDVLFAFMEYALINVDRSTFVSMNKATVIAYVLPWIAQGQYGMHWWLFLLKLLFNDVITLPWLFYRDIYVYLEERLIHLVGALYNNFICEVTRVMAIEAMDFRLESSVKNRPPEGPVAQSVFLQFSG